MATWRSLHSVAALIAACAGLGLSAGTADAGSPPNVVLFFVDDMGAADWQFDAQLNPTGSLVYETPNMLRLAQMGVTFENGYASAPVCSPSRASLMTGKSAANIGITDFIGAGSSTTGSLVRTTQTWRQNLPASEVTLPEAMLDAGYRTGFFGKWHLGQTGNPAANPLTAGFETNTAGVASGNPFFAGGFFAGADGAWAGMPGLNIPGTFPADKYLSDALAEAAADYIGDRAAADEPFFIFMSHYVVHTPIEAPQSLVNYYTSKIAGLTPMQVAGHTDATYAAMVQKMDESLGRLLDRLEDPDDDGQTDDSILGDTVIIFTADNGGLTNFAITSNRPFRAGKGSMYEGGIREPMIIAQPGNAAIPQGVVSGERAIGYDLYPTILDLAGVPGDPEQNAAMDGVSLRPALEAAGTGTGLAPRDLYWHYPHRSPQAVSNSLPVGGGAWVSAVLRGNHKLLYFYDERRFEHYDLDVDPSESNDIFGSDPVTAGELSRSLFGHMRRVEASMPRDIGSEVELPGPAVITEALVPGADAQFTDTFDDPHDFIVGGTAETGWDGLLNANLASVFNRGTATPGGLAFQNAGLTRVVAGDISAPVAYREVTGDFEVTMRIGSMQEQNFHVLALIAMDPADPQNEFLWVGQQNRAGANDFAQARDISGGVRTFDIGENGTFPYYRLCRRGSSFVGFFSPDGVMWVPFAETDRPDMPDTIWLGLTQALFGSTPALGVIDEFQIRDGCGVDLADPIGVLDRHDVIEYLQSGAADSFFDVLAYLAAFDEGCG